MQSSFSAVLVVGGTTFKILTCDYLFYQSTDAMGNAVAKVRSGEIEVVVEGAGDTLLMAWAADPLRKMSGEIIFFQGSQRLAVSEKLAFTDGSCVSYTEVLEPMNPVCAYMYQIKIVANKLSLNGAAHSNEWPAYA
ncbi:MAG TPA: type VI secretion system tube protein TssD [Hymenobacter sp.]|jgi:hypothetical protein